MKILLVGAGGYAKGYVVDLLKRKGSDVIFEGVVDPYFENAVMAREILEAGIPVYNTMDEFYENHTADLVIICTPTYLHKEQSIAALKHGSYVLTEKPVASVVTDVEEMIAAEKEYGKFIAVGYQMVFSDAMLALKADYKAGLLGAPVSLRTAISYPRSLEYYKRGGGWGGRISKNGIVVLDSIAANACAHYLQNMLFLLGKETDTSAEVATIEAECLRANDIENFDTCSMRMVTEDGARLYFVASHAAEQGRNPEFVYTFENATVTYSRDDSPRIVATFRDGTTKDYGNPFAKEFKKIDDCLNAIREGKTPVCTAKTAIAHTKLIEKIYHEVEIKNFPKDRVFLSEKTGGIAVKGLFEDMQNAYSRELLLSEI